ncbi:DUF4307 domain-containing protein [Streptomyces sp. NPDC059009]|uniref:DUF4307 domain-containing protein n=1 Tax=Streptomyces sp. NPDC059009 TaxID=3346694 RepID=UPI0036C78B50
MSAVSGGDLDGSAAQIPAQRPEGRYGRSSDERADRTLKLVGAALGAVLLVVIGWFAYHYVAASKISAEVITFDAVSDKAVKVHLEVRKDADASGYCTVRSQAEDGSEVGRADFRFDQDSGRVDKVVTLRTTGRGNTAELLGCHAD